MDGVIMRSGRKGDDEDECDDEANSTDAKRDLDGHDHGLLLLLLNQRLVLVRHFLIDL